MDSTKAVTLAMEKRFAVKNARGKNVFSIDAKGDGFMDGQVKPCYGGGCEGEGEGEGEGQTPSLDDLKSAGGKWVIQTSDGTVLAVVDPEWNTPQPNPADAQWPTLYLKGRLVSQPVTFQGPSVTLNPPDGSFVVKTTAGDVVAYINSVTDGDGNPPGSLVLARYFFAGHNPDPQAMQTVFLLYDDFDISTGSFGGTGERTSICSQCIARWPMAVVGQQCPQWSQDSGSWGLATDDYGGGQFVKSDGSGGANRLSIAQTYVDLDVDIDFKFEPDPTTGNVSPAQIVFRQTATDSLSLMIDPMEPSVCNHTVLKIQHGTQDLTSVDVTTLMDPTKLIDHESQDYSYVSELADSFSSNTWYEVHIQAVGNGILVLFRNRDGDYMIPPPPLPSPHHSDPPKDSGAGYKWIRWSPAVQLPALSGDQTQFALVAQPGYASDWSFDNIMVNSISVGN